MDKAKKTTFWIASSFLIILGVWFALPLIYSSDDYQVRVKQDIGGELLCDVSVQYGMSTTYYVDFSLIHGSGTKEYLGEGSYKLNDLWDEKPQVRNVSGIFVLVVGDGRSEKLLVKESDNKWIEFAFRDDQIFDEKLWKDIYSVKHKSYSGATALVHDLINDEIHIKYKFVIDGESEPQAFSEKKLIYRLHQESNKPSLELVDIQSD